MSTQPFEWKPRFTPPTEAEVGAGDRSLAQYQNGQWTDSYGEYIRSVWDSGDFVAWHPMPPKAKRYEVAEHGANNFCVFSRFANLNNCNYSAFAIPSREAAEQIAAIYERVTK